MEQYFLANISHELRTPLHGIVGYSQLLGQTKLDSTQIGYLNSINRCCIQLVEIVNDILDFSRLTTEKTQLYSECFSIKELTDEIDSVLGQRIKEKRQKIRYITEKNVPEYIVADKQKIIQILVNLVSNANKFTSSDGRIIVTFSLGLSSGNTLEISVEDNGIGISPEDQKNLFQPFVQVTPSHIKQGVGLGLVISKKLAEIMGGTMTVVSELGVGSTFTFSLRFDTYEQYGKTLQKDLKILEGKNILVVDSNVDNRLAVGDLLFDAGVMPVFCSSSKEAQKIVSLRKYKFSAGLIDISMTDYSGTKLAKQIKDLEPDLPLLAVSSVSDPIDLSSFESVVCRPINKVKLMDALCRIVKKGNVDTFELNPVEIPAEKKLGPKVLAVEDVSYNLEMLVKMLGNIGYKDVDTASDGDEAIEKLKKNTYTAMLLDLKMPRVSGLSVLEYVSTMDTYTKPRVAVLTASTMDEDREKCRTYGVKYFLLKPFSVGHLKSIMERLIYGTVKK